MSDHIKDTSFEWDGGDAPKVPGKNELSERLSVLMERLDDAEMVLRRCEAFGSMIAKNYFERWKNKSTS